MTNIKIILVLAPFVLFIIAQYNAMGFMWETTKTGFYIWEGIAAGCALIVATIFQKTSHKSKVTTPFSLV